MARFATLPGTASPGDHSALFALGVVLLVGHPPLHALSHLPALCGFMCNWPWGLAVDFPLLLRSMIGMPAVWVAMAFEMATCGAIAD